MVAESYRDYGTLWPGSGRGYGISGLETTVVMALGDIVVSKVSMDDTMAA